jgi:ABC-type multidrug transport system fused ATPase/permease subunit
VAQVQDNLSGVAVIKAFVQERDRARQVEARSRAFRDTMTAANMVSLVPAGIIEAAGGLGIVLVIWGGGTMAMEGVISVADLFVFIVYLGHIYQPFLQLATLHDVLQKAAASTQRIFELLAVQPDVADAPDAVAHACADRDNRFRGVTFC